MASDAVKDGVDLGRRRMLTATTAVVGAVGALYAAVPFVASMQPSARARAAGAPVEAEIGGLEPGQKMTVEWRGKPVWIVRRTEKNLADLPSLDGEVSDPASDVLDQQPTYAKNPARAIKDEYLVVIGLCTHLGCSPTYMPVEAPPGTDNWKGGFFCPCHGSKFDLAGRVYQGVPAPTNLVVPPHSYLTDTRIVVGVDQEAA
ncbi:MAG: ubiquinol-cytochrome c reductase iron-sulfur subunit [Gammaproteobacteria bacterium]